MICIYCEIKVIIVSFIRIDKKKDFRLPSNLTKILNFLTDLIFRYLNILTKVPVYMIKIVDSKFEIQDLKFKITFSIRTLQ